MRPLSFIEQKKPILAKLNQDYSSAMIDATSAIASTLAASQAQASLLAIRLANESQRQIVDLLAEGALQSANPEHLGNLIDTSA